MYPFGRRKLLFQGASLALALPFHSSIAIPRPALPRAMVVDAVQMPAWIRKGAVRRPVSPGDTLATGDEVQTASGGALLLTLPNGSQARLAQRTRLGIRWLDTQEEGGTLMRARLQLLDGSLRVSTPAPAQAAVQHEVEISLRTANISVRSADVLAMSDVEHDAACLFEGSAGVTSREQGELLLDKPAAYWSRYADRPPQAVATVSPEEVVRFKASTDLRPGWGIAVQGALWRVVAVATPSRETATAVARRLVEAGFPAIVVSRAALEVRINGLSTQVDAAAVLEKMAAIEGVRGRVALGA